MRPKTQNYFQVQNAKLVTKLSPINSNVKILHYGFYDKELRNWKYSWAESHNVTNSEQDINMYLISGKGPRSGPNGMEFKKLPKDVVVEI